MAKNLKRKFSKQALRGSIGKLASYTEIYLSFLIIISIIILSLQVIFDFRTMLITVLHQNQSVHFSTLLSTAFELVIGIEFVKMLAKHTPGSTVEVLLYTIARQLIANEGSMVGVLFGVIAIAILYGIRKYFNDPVIIRNENEFLINGGTSIIEVNERCGTHIKAKEGNTVAGFIHNLAISKGDSLGAGYELLHKGYLYQVYSMDGELIKQVKIFKNPELM